MVDPERPAPSKPSVSKTMVMEDPDEGADEPDSARVRARRTDDAASTADPDGVRQGSGEESGVSRRTPSAGEVDSPPPKSSPGAQAEPPAATVPDAPALDRSPPTKTEIGEPPLDALKPPIGGRAPSYAASPATAAQQLYSAAYPGSPRGHPAPYAAYPPGYPAPYPAAPPAARGSSLGVVLAVTGLVVLLTLIASAIGVLVVLDYAEPSRREAPLSPVEVEADRPSGPAEVKPDTPEPPPSAATVERGSRDEPPGAPTRSPAEAPPSKPTAPPKTTKPAPTGTAPKSKAPPRATTTPDSTPAPSSTATSKSKPKRPRRPSRSRHGVTI